MQKRRSVPPGPRGVRVAGIPAMLNTASRNAPETQPAAFVTPWQTARSDYVVQSGGCPPDRQE